MDPLLDAGQEEDPIDTSLPPQDPTRPVAAQDPNPPAPGGRISQLLRQQQEPAPAPQEPATAPSAAPAGGGRIFQLIQQQRAQADQDALETYRAVVKRDPAKSRAANHAAAQTGLDQGTAERDLDAARQMAAQQEFERADLSKFSPTLQAKMRDPTFAAMAVDDWRNLSVYNRAAFAVESGALQSEQGYIRAREAIGLAFPGDAARLKAIKERMQFIPPTEGFYSAAEIFGQMRDVLPVAFATGLIAAAAAAPEEAATGPAAPLTAFGVFSTGVGATLLGHTFVIEGGQAYAELLDKGVDPTWARLGGLGVGAVNTWLEKMGLHFATEPITSTIKKAIGKKVAEELVRPTFRKAVATTAIGYAKAMAGEVSTEVAQEISNVVADGLATGKWDGVGERLGEIAAKTAYGMALLGLPGAGMQFAYENSQVARAERNVRWIARKQEAAMASKMREGAPEAFQDLSKDANAEAGTKTSYFQADEFFDAIEHGAADGGSLVADLEKIMPGFWGSLSKTEAARAGTVSMPSELFDTKLAGTTVGQALTPHLKYDPNHYSQREAEQVKALLPEMKRAVQKQVEAIGDTESQVQAIEDKLVEQLVATEGRGKSQAKDEASLVGAFVQTLADRLKQEPAEVMKRFPLSVILGEQIGTETDAGAFAQPGARGTFDPRTFVVQLMKTVRDTGANSTTFIHETGHFFLETYSILAKEKAHPLIVDDFNAFLNWRGITREQWDAMNTQERAPHHEAFAEEFEDAVLDGKAPAPGLRGLFDRLSAFMRQFYRKVRGMVRSPEIRAVIDRMLAAEHEVAATHAIRGAVPQFQTQAESGMNDAEWAAHQAKQQEVLDSAVRDRTAAAAKVMEWLSGAKGRRLAQMQSVHKGTRDAMKGVVANEVQQRPIYRAIRFLKTGEVVTEDGKHIETKEAHKLDREEFMSRGWFGDLTAEEAAAKLGSMLVKDGLPMDMVASGFGFEDSKQMIDALLAAPPIADVIESELDARMERDHSDLADPAKREAAVDASLHSEAARRFTAAELQALTHSLVPERLVLKAAEEQARLEIEKTPVNELSPKTFAAQARRASIKAQQALTQKGGDLQEAIDWKRKQLVLQFMADIAADARAKVAQGVREFRKFNKPDLAIAKTRDIDLARAAQALAAGYQLGPPIEGAQRQQLVKDAVSAVDQLHPVEAARLAPLLADVAKNKGPIDYKILSVAQFREVIETGKQLWAVAKDETQMTAEQEGAKRQVALEAMSQQLATLPPTSESKRASDAGSPGFWRQRMMGAWDVIAGTKVMEHVARFLDAGKADGPFQRYIVLPMMRLLKQYRAAKAPIIRKLAASIDEVQQRVGSRWHARITVPGLRAGGGSYTFNGLREIFGAMLHAGSNGNLEANLIGRGWADLDPETGNVDFTRWDAAVQWLFDNKILVKEDMGLLKTWWSTFADLLPQAQKAHRKRFGAEFPTIELRPVKTPWGTLEGGYVPKRPDRFKADPRFLQRYANDDTASTRTEDAQFSLGTKKGFTMGRVEDYRPPLNMDVGSMVSNVDEELRFIFLENGVNDTAKLLRGKVGENGPRFADVLNAYDRTLLNGVILPWLENTAMQRTSIPGKWWLLDRAVSAMRSAASVAALGLNLANSMLQAGGVSNARLYVKGNYLRSATRTFFFHPWQSYKSMTTRSGFMAQKLDRQTMKLQQQIARSSQGGIQATVTGMRQFMARWAFLPQAMFQTFSDTVTWHGGYAQAIAEGAGEETAIERADQAVRLAQGTGHAESLADYAISTPMVQLFTQFGNYSNLVLNQIMGAQSRTHAFTFALLLPAVLELAVKTAFRGGPEDKDDDDSVIDDLAVSGLKTFSRNVLGLLPLVGPFAQQIAESDGTRMLEAPGSAIMRDAYRGVLAGFDVLTGAEATEARVNLFAQALTLATGMPVSAPTRAVQAAARAKRAN